MTQLMTVREARYARRRPMTQDELAAKSGVDQTYISLVERLRRNPSQDIKRRLAKALGMPQSSLRFGPPESSPVTQESDSNSSGVSSAV